MVGSSSSFVDDSGLRVVEGSVGLDVETDSSRFCWTVTFWSGISVTFNEVVRSEESEVLMRIVVFEEGRVEGREVVVWVFVVELTEVGIVGVVLFWTSVRFRLGMLVVVIEVSRFVTLVEGLGFLVVFGGFAEASFVTTF